MELDRANSPSFVNPSFKISDDEVGMFKEKGFVILKQFFTDAFLSYVRAKLDEDLQAPVDKYTSVFNRVKYDSFNNDEKLLNMMQEVAFRHTLTNITRRSLFYTQSIGFEVRENESKGFPWHIGSQSFAYQRGSDFACSLWVPFIKIDNAVQGGGMSYVPKNILSGEFGYQYTKLVAPYLVNKMRTDDSVNFSSFNEMKNGYLNNFPMKDVLDYYCESHDYELGDALLFDKFVIHKTNKLELGELNTRAAFVMRFIDSESVYDAERAQIQEIPRDIFHYDGASKFHIEVCKKNGERIAESNVFQGKEQRLISPKS